MSKGVEVLYLHDPSQIPSVLDLFIFTPKTSGKMCNISKRFSAEDASDTKVLTSHTIWWKASLHLLNHLYHDSNKFCHSIQVSMCFLCFRLNRLPARILYRNYCCAALQIDFFPARRVMVVNMKSILWIFLVVLLKIVQSRVCWGL